MLKTPKVPQGAVVRRQARSKAPGASTTHKTQHVGAYAYATEREEADKGGGGLKCANASVEAYSTRPS